MKLKAKVTSVEATHDILWGDTMRIPDEYRNVIIIKFELLEEFKKQGYSLKELRIFEKEFHGTFDLDKASDPYMNIPDLEVGCIIEISEPLYRADTYSIPGHKLTHEKKSISAIPGAGFEHVSDKIHYKTVDKRKILPPLSIKTAVVASARERESVVKVIEKAKSD